jgi:hypothetical protein
MSTVFYRWGAGRDESRVTFDGTHISVFDLKREIILANKMGNGKDFDIGVYDNVTGEGKLVLAPWPSSMRSDCRIQGRQSSDPSIFVSHCPSPAFIH